MRNQLPQKRGHSSPQFSVHICCGQTAGSIRMPLDMEVRLGPGRFVLMGSWAPALPLKGAQPPIFDPYLLWPNGWIKMPLGTQVGLGPGEVVLDGDLAPPTERGTAPPQFSAHVCCGQNAGWIKMPLGREWASALVTLCWMGTQLPFPKGSPPVFGPSILWPNGRPS